ncbi:hypothetical protein AB7714_26215 [Tardiphaga sp. 1201_B9_N1_1]|uniref:arsenate reductase/protein-tyrosine-phosphatase family protein n=1 Tax=unclassified Tardiphaga TaxID=2631404 RepID=UPI000E7343B8
MARTVLFLCTGNYYRSRYAEELFNHLARRAGLTGRRCRSLWPSSGAGTISARWRDRPSTL